MFISDPSHTPLLRAAARTRRRFAALVVAGVAGLGALSGVWRDASAAWPHLRLDARRTVPDVATADAVTGPPAQAFESMRSGRFAEAYGRFAAHADAGEPGAALMALALVRHGAQINGNAWSATPGQIRRWSALAAQDLREQARTLGEHERGE